MIIAHTPTIPRTQSDMQRFGGKVWIVDTGISRVYRGKATALIIQNGYFNVWGLGDEKSNETAPAYPHFSGFHLGSLCPIPAGR
jgi:hypothetical protein